MGIMLSGQNQFDAQSGKEGSRSIVGRFKRLAEIGREPIILLVDGEPVTALEGDTLMVAMLGDGQHLRNSEFGDGKRAGFCLMGACQDCWVWTEDGERLRACSTLAGDGMRISTAQPEATWSSLA
jgi:aerobic-type carbon monoxide dehydrogenase small subunit (CoxS/CutS family)